MTDLSASPTAVDYLEGLMEGFVAYRADWRITYMNAAAERLLGRPREALLGRTWQEAFPHGVGTPLEAMYQRVMASRRAERVELHYPHYGRWFEVSASPLASGGIGVYFSDITDRVEAQRAVQESEWRYRAVTRVSNDLVWDHDLATGAVTVEEGVMQPFGYGTERLAVAPGWGEERIHPDDRARVMAALRAAIKGPGDFWHAEFRFRRADGGYADVSARIQLARDAAGRVARVIGAFSDLTPRKRVEARLREADRRKDEFLATLAHELRNPLAPIRNAVEVLHLRTPSDPALQAARDIIGRQLQHMVRLIDDLLDVSRITRGKLELRRSRITLAAVIEQALETSRPHLQGHEFTMALPPEPVWLDADPVRLAQVFSNLLHNACKYTGTGGRIGLAAERLGAEVAVSVRDSGIGIAPEQLPRLFQLFSQDAAALERSQGGLGIGLSLARALARMHGGDITVRSEGPGRGSEFTVRLPLAPAAAAAAAPARERAAACGGRRLLVVDDNADNAESLALLFRLAGNEVRTAHDGVAALRAGAELRPDLVVLDLGLPRMNGYDTCRAMRAEPWGREATIVALTGWGQEEDQRRCTEAGFDAHLLKPADPDALMRLLAAHRR
ncbi:MAG TPA: ATP-binding protein [Burkholderiales bacterium]|nr:ATP-binding protein [Burkholderiales bacterium]